jgi:hypothetical protein
MIDTYHRVHQQGRRPGPAIGNGSVAVKEGQGDSDDRQGQHQWRNEGQPAP